MAGLVCAQRGYACAAGAVERRPRLLGGGTAGPSPYPHMPSLPFPSRPHGCSMLWRGQREKRGQTPACLLARSKEKCHPAPPHIACCRRGRGKAGCRGQWARQKEMDSTEARYHRCSGKCRLPSCRSLSPAGEMSSPARPSILASVRPCVNAGTPTPNPQAVEAGKGGKGRPAALGTIP